MTMTYLWTALLFLSVVFAFATGNTSQVSAASLQGATTAVELAFSMTGVICLWTGMMEVMSQCGLADKLGNLLRPLLQKLFPDVADDPKTLGDISANVSANLLGLGNASTPLGLKAVKGLSSSVKDGRATASLCLFVVCNSASIQLIPTTIASIRSATGSENPFEILPAVWITSFVSITVGITICKLCEKISKKTRGKRVKP